MFASDTKILIVDDMMTMRKIVMKACREMGLTDLAEAGDGQIAWRRLNETPGFGLIISDWNMPNCSGLDLLKRVRADGRLGRTPFLLLTAESEMSQVQEAIKAGVDGYLVKPFTAESLALRLRDVYKKRGLDIEGMATIVQR